MSSTPITAGTPADESPALSAPAAAGDEISLRVVLDLRVAGNGCDPTDFAECLERRLHDSIIGAGLITGSSPAELDEHALTVHLLSPEEAGLDEDAIEAWIGAQLESGGIRLETVSRLLARYALADPADMRAELAERMALNDD